MIFLCGRNIWFVYFLGFCGDDYKDGEYNGLLVRIMIMIVRIMIMIVKIMMILMVRMTILRENGEEVKYKHFLICHGGHLLKLIQTQKCIEV